MTDKRQPTVSFIIPVYNLPAEMVRKCIGSITALSLGEWEREIIVVDDGSEVALKNELGDMSNHILCVRQENKGLAGARNTGIGLATGRYIQFVDGDDKLISSSYEYCLDIVRRKQPDVVMFNVGTPRGHQDVRRGYRQAVSGSDYMSNNNLRAAAYGYIFSRETLGDLRFDETLRSHEDEDFTPRLLLRAGRLIETPANAYYYRQRSGSIMHERAPRHVEERLRNMETVLLRLRDMAAVAADKDKAGLNRRVAQLTMDYLYNTIRLRRSCRQLEAVISRLGNEGLFPLPHRNYTRKYCLFRHAINCRLLRALSVIFLP